jgi:tape measure domain-containing protein
MATIDDKVVAMSFESGKFESGIDKAISALDKLKKALHFPSAGKGLDDINAAGKKIDLSHIGKALDDIKGKFGALSVAALAVFANIATKAVSAGTQIVKAFTLDPIIQGFHEYELQINAVQTILGNTAAAGTNLKDVNKALDQLNKYADLTIYNFGQMTKNIGTFTAAGVDLETSVSSIKGIANIAALSGSSAEQASTAMYQLSQAISSGRVALQDWKSVENASMGSATFKRALVETAVQMGTLKDSAVQMVGPMKNIKIHGESFRDSISSRPGQKNWLTSDVLTTTLKHLSGDLTDAQLKAEGYSDAQIKSIQGTAKLALDAATKVKTLSQLIDTTKEQVGSGWASTWEIIFGDFGEAKTLFTGLSKAIGNFVGQSANARNKVLQDWKDLGGRTLLIDSLKKAFQALGAVLKPIKDAFHDIFPPATGKDLFDLTKRFHDFVETLTPSPQTIENLRRTFRGLFAVLDIGKQVVEGIFSVFGHLFGAVAGGSGGFLELTGNIGDMLVSFDQALKKGGLIQGFFDGLGKVLAVPIALIGKLAGAIADLFSTKASGGVSGALGGLGSSLSPLQKIVESLHTAWDKLMDALSGSKSTWVEVGKNINEFFSGLGTMIGNAISGINWDTVLSVINTGLFAALVLMFKKFFGGAGKQQLSGGILQSLTGVFTGLQGALVSLQQNIKAKTLKEIAIAVGILAASLFVLSLIDPKKMQSAITGMTIAFGELIGAMALLEKVTMTGGFIKMPVIAAGLIGLSVAIGILTLAVKNLSGLSWEELAKGLGGVAVLLTALSIASGPLSRNSAGMITAGVGIAAIAIALKILASAVADFGGLSWTALAKGMLSVAASLVIIGGAARLFPTGMIAIGAGLIAVGVGLKFIASAVATFGGMDLASLGKGMLGLAGSLVIIAGAMQIMPPNMVVQAAGLLVAAAAIKILASALGQMGGMSIGAIGKGLLALGGALVILAAGAIAMEGAMGGALALSVLAASIALLAPALKTLGGMGWVGIIKSIVALTAAFVLLGAAGILLAPVIPELLGLGAALLLIGAGLALAGTGIALVGVGLSAIAATGSVAIGVLLDAITKFIAAIPAFSQNFVLGLLSVVQAVAKTAPQFVAAIVTIIDQLLVAITQSAPKIATAFTALLDAGLKILKDNQGKIIQAGFDLIIALLTGLRNNIPAIVNMVTQIITKFLTAMTGQANKIVTAGANFIVSIIRGISNNMNKIVTEAAHVVTSFVTALANQYTKIVTAGVDAIVHLITGIGNAGPRIVTAAVEAIVKFINAVGDQGPKIVTAAVNTMVKFIHTIQKEGNKLIDEGATAAINFINGVADTLEKREGDLVKAAFHLGTAVVTGLATGLADIPGLVAHAAASLGKSIVNGIKKNVPFMSPYARVGYETGVGVGLGLVAGMEDTSKQVNDSAVAMATGVITGVKNTFQITSPSKVMADLGQFVGEGFADGLRGSESDIRAATDDLNQKLTDAIQKFHDTATTHQASLDALEKKHDTLSKATGNHKKELSSLNEEIKKQNAIVELNNSAIKIAVQARTELNKGLKKTREDLIKESKLFDDANQRLDAAQQKLTSLIEERATARQSYIDQYTETPILATTEDGKAAADQLGPYTQALANQAAEVAVYSQTLEKLRALGLDDTTYKKLLREGTADQAFAQQLLDGGVAVVANLNQLDINLSSQAGKLGDDASQELFNAGIRVQQHFVAGIVDEKAGYRAEMVRLATEIANTLTQTLRKKLKSKSPSEVAKEIGGDFVEGLSAGLTDSTKVVEDAADQVGSAAIEAMKKSMSGVSDALSAEIAQPTITPILDLTQVQRDAQSMQSLLDANAIAARASFQQASSISTGLSTLDVDSTAAVVGTSIKFEQNNYSPESLSAIDIYRQTKNQLAQAQLAIT